MNHNLGNIYIIFGGTFDPIHEGHLEAITSLIEEFPTVILAPANANPWKKSKPSDIGHRLEMIRLALNSKNLFFSENDSAEGLILCKYPYTYSKDLVKYLRDMREGNVLWAISEDLGTSYTKWKDWDTLNLQIKTLPINTDIHSTQIRKKQKSPLPSIQEYIKNNKLY